MFYTEREIMTQQDALEKSFQAIAGSPEKWLASFGPGRTNRFVFMGCGSSYMMAKSAQRLFGVKPNVTATALAGGDYLLNPGLYRHIVENSLVVFLSRSGKTSEILMAAQEVRRYAGVSVASIVMTKDSSLEKLSDCSLVLPWAFDESVCQTRTISNFYAALLLLAALYDGDYRQIEDVRKAIAKTGPFLLANRPRLEEIAKAGFSDAVVLADGVLCGIGEEAALAFTEIAMTSGRYHHILDYRHGPMVLNSPRTLTIFAMQPGNEKLQRDMLGDVRKKGGTTVVLCPDGSEGIYESDLTIPCGGLELYASYGLPLICIAQLAALSKALLDGVNPDQPSGLDAYIHL